MAKLYVTNLIILNPRDISSCDNKIKTYDSEKILVKKHYLVMKKFLQNIRYIRLTLLEEIMAAMMIYIRL